MQGLKAFDKVKNVFKTFPQELFKGKVPVNKELLTGTVPVNKDLLAGTVPVNKELLTGRVPVNNLFLFLFIIFLDFLFLFVLYDILDLITSLKDFYYVFTDESNTRRFLLRSAQIRYRITLDA